jgi:hypothetical protein
MKRTAFGLALLAGCAAPATETWTSTESPPIAALGPAAPFGAEMIATVIGPFEADAEVQELDLVGAPGWGCSSPTVLHVGAWATRIASPTRPPLVEKLPVLATRDLGEGFEGRHVPLAPPLDVFEGELLAVVLALDTSDACGAKATGPGRTWRWRGGRWERIEGEMIARAIGRED